MATEISNLVINYIEKPLEGDVFVRNREDVIEITEQVRAFIEQLHFAYNSKPAKGFCAFSSEKSDVFQAQLHSLVNKELSFVEFSNTATNLLCQELEKYDFEENGYFLLCEYQYLTTEFLFILQLSSKEHFSVTADLSISSNRHVDLSSLQLAARIDLTEWRINPDSNRYISFVKGRAGRKVSDFFLDFLGCEEGIDAKQQSAVLLEAVEEYIQAAPAEADQKADTRKEVLKYCTERVQLGEDASVRDLTELFQESPAVPEVPFDDFSVQQGYSLEERFPVDRKTMTALVKFSGQGGGVSVGFEKKLLGETIFYDQTSDTLTIKKIPANLRDQIIRYLNNQTHPFMDE